MKKNHIFIKKIKKFFFINKFLNIKKLYILSVSGGQDSICLLFFFYLIKKQFSIKIHILYCNHLWQYDTFFHSIQLRQICFLLKIKFSQTIPNFFLYNENQARFWRLEVFSRFCFFFKSFFIITGHSLTDRIETFFLNLIRGAGLTGLQSFNEKKKLFIKKRNSFFLGNNFFFFFKKKILFSIGKKTKIFKNKNFKNKSFLLEYLKNNKYFLLRPFCLINRSEIKNFLEIVKLPIFPDKTNYNYKYKRNRLRKQIFPVLRIFFNKQIHFNILKIIEIISFNEKEKLKEILPFHKKIILINKNFFCINVELFKKLSTENQKRLIFIFFKNINHKYTNFIVIKNFISVLKKIKKDKKTYFIHNLFIIPKIGFIGKHKNYIYIIKY